MHPVYWLQNLYLLFWKRQSSTRSGMPTQHMCTIAPDAGMFTTELNGKKTDATFLQNGLARVWLVERPQPLKKPWHLGCCVCMQAKMGGNFGRCRGGAKLSNIIRHGKSASTPGWCIPLLWIYWAPHQQQVTQIFAERETWITSSFLRIADVSGLMQDALSTHVVCRTT